MLYLRWFTRIILLSFALFGLSVQSAYSASFNIDFGQTFKNLPGSYGAAAGQTGHWNDIATGLTTNLVDTSGFVTEVDLNLIATATGNDANAHGNDEFLLNDNFYSEDGASWSVTLSNLSQGSYDIYYYAPSNIRVSTGFFSVNGLNVRRLPGKPIPSSLVRNVSWGLLTGVQVDGTSILSLESNARNTYGYRGLAGLQIVSVNAVPVPAAVWLFGTALIGLVGFGKRKRTTA